MAPQLSVFCPACGKRVKRVVDENCPPSSVRCPCGLRIPLRIEVYPRRFATEKAVSELDWDLEEILRDLVS